MEKYDKNQTDIVLSFVSDLRTGQQLSGGKRRYDLLQYLVCAELEDRSTDLKAYSIAIDVLGRGPSFDPSSDSIVRVEVARLRDSLTLYYAQGSTPNAPQITIPKGTYRPKITFPATPTTNPKSWPKMAAMAACVALIIGLGLMLFQSKMNSQNIETAGSFTGPRIAALPFEFAGGVEEADDFAYGLGVDTVSELSRFGWLSVYMVLERPSNIKDITGVDYVLTGIVRTDADKFIATITLLQGDSGRVMWSKNYERPHTAAGLLEVQSEAATEIAGEIARPEGTLATLESRRVVRDTTLSDSAYSCIFMLYEYWRDFTEETHFLVRECLETAIIEEPNYAEAHGALAFMFIDEAYKGYNARVGYDPWERAYFHAQRGYVLNQKSAISAQALFTYYSRKRDLGNFLRIGNQALIDFANNPEVLADYGNKLAVNLGQLEQGAAITNKALDLNHTPPGWYYISPTLQAYADKEYTTAQAYSEKILYVESFYGMTVAISSAIALEDTQEAMKHKALFDERYGYTYAETIARLGENWEGHKIMRSFEKHLEVAFTNYPSL